VDDFRRIKKETYLEFGLELKEKQHSHRFGFGRLNSEIKFLGSGFHYLEFIGRYVPYPNVHKICSTLKYIIDEKTYADVYSKAVALTALAAPVPRLFEECKRFLEFLTYNYNPSDNGVPGDWIQLAKSPGHCANYWIMWMLGYQTCFIGWQEAKQMSKKGAKTVVIVQKGNKGPAQPKGKRSGQLAVVRMPRKPRLRGYGDYDVVLPPPITSPVQEKQKEKRWYEMHIGDAMGDFANTLSKMAFGSVNGLGDYNVETNSLVANLTKGIKGNEIPIMQNSKHCNIIRHREYIGDILGTSDLFSFTKYPINPGLFTTFPWGQTVCNSYQRYRWRGLVFEYIPESADYAANTAMGYVGMATLYNPYLPDFPDKTTFMNSEFANSRKPSKAFMHPIECNPYDHGS